MGSQNAKLSTVEASNYSRPSDNTDTYAPKESDTSADELALTSSSYPVKEPERSADELVFTSFSRLVEDDISADELDHTTYTKPATSKKHLGKRSKAVSRDPRSCTSTEV